MDNLLNFAELISIDSHAIFLLIALPIVATIVGFAHYIIGIKTISIYFPIILTFMFYELGVQENSLVSNQFNGLKYGISLSIIIFGASATSYELIRKLSLHYYTKLSIVITCVVITLLAFLIIAGLFDKQGFLKINIFSLILIASLAERYMNLLAFNSKKSATKLSFETLVLSIICYLFISWSIIQNFIIDNTWILFILLPINYYIGKFSGLRLLEYYRFKDILNNND
jgi:hypothetical protein